MSRKRYYFDHLIKDNVLRFLVSEAEVTLQYLDILVEMYHQFNIALFGQSPEHFSYLMAVNNQSVFSPSPVNNRSSSQQHVVSTGPETSFQTTSTFLKGSPNTSRLQRNDLPLDNANNEELKNLIESGNKQSSLGENRNFSDCEIGNPKRVPVDNTDDDVILIRSTSQIPLVTDQVRLPPKMRRKQWDLITANENVMKPKSCPYKCLPPDYNYIEDVKAVKLGANTPFRRQTVIIHPQKMDKVISNTMKENSFEVAERHASSVALSFETDVNLNSKKRKSDQIAEMPAFFSANERNNTRPGKEISDEAIPTHEEKENPKHLPVDDTDDEVIQVKITSAIPFATNRKSLPPKIRLKQWTSENVIEPESLPLCHEHIDSLKTVELGTGTRFRQRTMITSCQKPDRLILNTENENTVYSVSSVSQSLEIPPNPETERRKSVEIEEVSAIFSVDDKYNTNPVKEAKVDAKSTTYGEKNINFAYKVKTPHKRKNVSVAEGSQPMENETMYFVERSKIPHNFPPNIQESVSSGENPKILDRSDHNSNMNIRLNRGSQVTEASEEKRKFFIPRSYTMLFRSMPSYIRTVRGAEIEFDVSWASVPISSYASTFSPTDYRSGKTVRYNEDNNRSPKDICFSVDESKPGSSRDFNASSHNILNISSTAAKANILTRDDGSNLEKDRLSYESSKGSFPINISVKTAFSPAINNLEPNTFKNYILEFYNLLQMRESYMQQFFMSLLIFKKGLNLLYCFMQSIQKVVQCIILQKDILNEGLKKNILTLTRVTSQLMDNVCTWKMDVHTAHSSWITYSTESSNLRARYEPFMYTDPSIATIKLLRVFEEDLKIIWKKVDNIILHVESIKSSFITAAINFEILVNLFVTILITFGILKPVNNSEVLILQRK